MNNFAQLTSSKTITTTTSSTNNSSPSKQVLVNNSNTTNSSSHHTSIIASPPNNSHNHRHGQTKLAPSSLTYPKSPTSVHTTNDFALMEEIKAGSHVTATTRYEGRSEEHELSFEYGDLIRIIKIIQKDPQWAMGDLKGKQGYVLLNCVKPRSVTMPWFHGNLTREQAEFLLKDLPEGSFLMRESTHYPGDFTLCLKSDNKIENYHIKLKSNKFTIDDEHLFSNLIELIEFYTKHDHLACILTNPIKYLKKKESSSDYQALLNSLWIDENAIKMGKEIGFGEFGAVYRGSYNNTDVAVKKIKDHATVDEFLKEAFVMSTLSHPNLVKLIGVVKHCLPNSEKFEISLVTEFMPKGSLLDYLTSRGRSVLTKKELLQFVIHICDGMSYLEEKGIVHRDLAASNVLVSKEDIAKVSDFGLAKKILDDNNKNSRIRIKWTAPEAIKEKLYSNKSDMWSFGILLWEIFSYGRVPYPKIPVNEVMNQIEQGYQMEKPDGCPDEIYALMKETWQYDRTLRPSFSTMLTKLHKLKSKIIES